MSCLCPEATFEKKSYVPKSVGICIQANDETAIGGTRTCRAGPRTRDCVTGVDDIHRRKRVIAHGLYHERLDILS